MSGAHCRTCWRYRGFAATSKTVAATRPMASNAARSTNRAYGENRWACTDGSAVNSGKADRIDSCKLKTSTTSHAHRWLSCAPRSEEHTSELPSLMRITYADFCLKQKKP